MTCPLIFCEVFGSRNSLQAPLEHGPILRTFLLEPSQSWPPQALRCQTQSDLQQSLGPGIRAHGGKKRHGRHQVAAALHPQTPVQEMLGALADKNG